MVAVTLLQMAVEMALQNLIVTGDMEAAAQVQVTPLVLQESFGSSTMVRDDS